MNASNYNSYYSTPLAQRFSYRYHILGRGVLFWFSITVNIICVCISASCIQTKYFSNHTGRHLVFFRDGNSWGASNDTWTWNAHFLQMRHLILHIRLINGDTTLATWKIKQRWYSRDFPKPVGRLINIELLSFIDYFPNSRFCCAFKIEMSYSPHKRFLGSPYFSIKHAIWLVTLLWRAQFSGYVTSMVIAWNGIKEWCSNVSSRLWGGSFRDDSKTAARETDFL